MFQQQAFQRPERVSTLGRLVGWLDNGLRWLLDAIGNAPPAARHGIAASAGIVLLLIGARIAWGAFVARDRSGRFAVSDRARGGRSRAGDPWVIARAAAARGDYTAGAHALYQALLELVAREDRVRLHPSKTVGDYARDLRARSSARHAGFRDFARSYERVIYGDGFCDQERFDRLETLAAGLARRAA